LERELAGMRAAFSFEKRRVYQHAVDFADTAASAEELGRELVEVVLPV